MTLNIESPRVYTRDGVAISVSGVAQVKIDADDNEMLRSACQQFLGMSQEAITMVAHQTLEGHQRAIMGTMTVEEIYQDRKKFAEAVYQVSSPDLKKMGIATVSYTIKDVRDEEGYLEALGKKRTAEVKRDASIGESEAARDAGIRAADADQRRFAAQYENEIEVAKSKRDYELKKAAYDRDVNTKSADAALAYELQSARTKQRIKEEEIQIEVVARRKQIEVQTQEVVRRERELEATVRQPATAEKYRIETLAAAEQKRIVIEAQAQAKATQTKGAAEAYAIEQKAKAEYEQMRKKAEAFREYQRAAVVDMLLQTLPRVAAEVAHPLTGASKIVLVGSGSTEVGIAKITGEILGAVKMIPKAMEEMTGISLSSAAAPSQ